ncbi:MAG: glycosyltransferase family 2 protein [bacterium]
MDQSLGKGGVELPMPRKACIVLPAYNEEFSIGRLLGRIEEVMHESSYPYQVILVDDGSRDNTAKIVGEYSKRIPVVIKQHKVNLGLGATIRDGLMAAAELTADRDIIVTMDADDTHMPALILRMIQMIDEGHDVVIASRYQAGARTIGVPVLRRLMSFMASFLFRILFPIPGVRDFTCGYRAYRSTVIKDAIKKYGKSLFNQQGFQCMADILLKLRRMNLVFGELPIILRYDFKKGKSKMDVMHTAWKTFILVLVRRLGK